MENIDGAVYIYTAQIPDEYSVDGDARIPEIKVTVGNPGGAVGYGGNTDLTNAVASITIDGTPEYYSTFEAAFTDAENHDGCTVVALKDSSTTESITISGGTFTFDLNGKNLSDGGASVNIIVEGNAKVTIKDTKPDNTDGSLGNVSLVSGSTGYLKLQGGAYNNITAPSGAIADLLGEGYGIKDGWSNWLTASDLQESSTSNTLARGLFCVQAAPVTITNQSGSKIDLYANSETADKTLSVTANPTSGVSYQWQTYNSTFNSWDCN